MGTVYLAEDEGLSRLVAVKTLLPKVARDPVAKERFLREGRLASSIKSDNVVVVHAVGEEKGVPYLAMEYLKGFSLEDLLRTKGAAVSVLQALGIGRQVARGLAAAHEKGLVHRDVKPANIWLETSDEATPGVPGQMSRRHRVKLLDFGMAKPHEGGGGLTRAGDVVGTPLYMSPERAVPGYKPDPRSDLFSLGVVLYRLCTGTFPFLGNTTANLFKAVATTRPVSTKKKNAEVPAVLSKLIDKLLEKRPADRPSSARLVADTLERIEREVRYGPGPEDDELGREQLRAERYRRQLMWSRAANVGLGILFLATLIWVLLR
jgi:serine/threonine protein kinase